MLTTSEKQVFVNSSRVFHHEILQACMATDALTGGVQCRTTYAHKEDTWGWRCWNCNGNSQKKYDGTAPWEILVKIWLLRHGQTGGCMWPNWRMLVRRPLWNYVWWNFFQVAKTWSPRIDGSNYTPFFQLKNFYGRENDLQSWNPTFLGIRSPNPLPISSGLGNLTSDTPLPPKRSAWPLFHSFFLTPSLTWGVGKYKTI